MTDGIQSRSPPGSLVTDPVVSVEKATGGLPVGSL